MAEEHEKATNRRPAHEGFISVATAGQIFDLSPAAIRGMMNRGELRFFKLGNRVRLLASDIENLLIHHPSKDEAL